MPKVAKTMPSACMHDHHTWQQLQSLTLLFRRKGGALGSALRGGKGHWQLQTGEGSTDDRAVSDATKTTTEKLERLVARCLKIGLLWPTHHLHGHWSRIVSIEQCSLALLKLGASVSFLVKLLSVNARSLSCKLPQGGSLFALLAPFGKFVLRIVQYG